jgi:hypothetical protein
MTGPEMGDLVAVGKVAAVVAAEGGEGGGPHCDVPAGLM